jgi:membrane protease YdiL (CAAX protease family)
MPSDAPPESPPDAVPQVAESYWRESRRPGVSLVFIVPMLAAYEIGVWFFNEQTGVDVWMKSFLNLFGFSQHFLLPAITAGILLGWHYLIRERWRFSPRVLSVMVVECLVLAVGLQALRAVLLLSSAGPDRSMGGLFQQALVYLGTGVYEELLFRLMLFSSLRWIARFFWPDSKKSWVLAMLVSSLVFAAAHFIGSAGYPFSWPYFVFLFLAGVFFTLVFVYRGFGIAAGTHALYDILTCLFQF